MCQCPKSLEVTSQLEIRTIDMKQIQYVKLDIHDSALLVIGYWAYASAPEVLQ